MAAFIFMIKFSIGRGIDSYQMRYLLFLFLFIFSALAFSDEYPAQRKYFISQYSTFCTALPAVDHVACILPELNKSSTFQYTFQAWQIPPEDHGWSTGSNKSWFTNRTTISTGSVVTDSVNATMFVYCDFGGTHNGLGVCVDAPACPDGEVRDANGQCSTPPVVCEDGRELDSGFYLSANNPIACISGCSALRVSTGAPQLDCGYGGAGVGTCSYVFPARYVDTGEACSPDAVPPKETPQPDCPQCRCMESGGAWGSVNGVNACVPQGSAGSNPVTKPSKPPTTTTTTPAPTPENPNPEPVTTTTNAPVITVTPPPAGSPSGTPPTVTETITDENGGTITTEKDKKTFCQENPTAQICKGDDESVFQGSCGSFRCDGDAVQCAIALKIHNDHCNDMQGLSEYSSAANTGANLLQGQLDADVTQFLNRGGDSNQTIDLSTAITETGQYNFGGQCFNDVAISAGPFSFTLPLSQLCFIFLALGYALLAGSYYSSLRIVGII